MISPEKRSVIMRFIQHNMPTTTPTHIISKIEERLYNLANGDYTSYCDITTIRQRIQQVLEIFNERKKASTARGLATRFDKSKKKASTKRGIDEPQSEESKKKKTNCGQMYIELLNTSIFDGEDAAAALMSMGMTEASSSPPMSMGMTEASSSPPTSMGMTEASSSPPTSMGMTSNIKF